MLRLIVVACVAAAGAVNVQGAQVYRCVDAQGRIEYADVPCPRGAGGPITISPNVVPGLDQATVRALSNAIDQRSAARALADQQARVARTPPVEMPTDEGGTPWWQQPGPPPDRDPNRPKPGSGFNPPTAQPRFPPADVNPSMPAPTPHALGR